MSALSLGCGLCLYEGAPHTPKLDNLWQVAEAMQATAVGVSPRYLEVCRSTDLPLAALQEIFSTGAPLLPEHYRIVYEGIKKDLHLASISGGTDIISCFVLGNVMLPVKSGEIQVKGLGMDVHAYDTQARSIIGTKGDLVCTTPFVSMPKGFLHDAQGEKYRAAYFSHYPEQEVWRHGDFIEITEEGGIRILGRSDTVLNPHGIRYGSAEIYQQLAGIKEVVDAIVIDTSRCGVVLLVKLTAGKQLNSALITQINRHIAEGLTKRHLPKHVLQVDDLPYTMNGKKMEILAKQVFDGESRTHNIAGLANPAALSALAKARASV